MKSLFLIVFAFIFASVTLQQKTYADGTNTDVPEKEIIIVEGDIAKYVSDDDKSAPDDSFRLWKDATIIYEISEELTNSQKSVIKGAIDNLDSITNLDFRKKNERDNNYLYFEMKDKNSCWSFIGRVRGKQTLNLGNGCYDRGTIMHEILHAVGMRHEQSRPDRDDYIVIKWDNIEEDSKSNFKMGNNIHTDTKYDFRSIMHYGSYAFSKNRRPTITTIDGQVFRSNRTNLTPTDIEGVNFLYSNL